LSRLPASEQAIELARVLNEREANIQRQAVWKSDPRAGKSPLASQSYWRANGAYVESNELPRQNSEKLTRLAGSRSGSTISSPSFLLPPTQGDSVRPRQGAGAKPRRAHYPSGVSSKAATYRHGSGCAEDYRSITSGKVAAPCAQESCRPFSPSIHLCMRICSLMR
jgi:hypothetical protein